MYRMILLPVLLWSQPAPTALELQFHKPPSTFAVANRQGRCRLMYRHLQNLKTEPEAAVKALRHLAAEMQNDYRTDATDPAARVDGAITSATGQRRFNAHRQALLEALAAGDMNSTTRQCIRCHTDFVTLPPALPAPVMPRP